MITTIFILLAIASPLTAPWLSDEVRLWALVIAWLAIGGKSVLNVLRGK